MCRLFTINKNNDYSFKINLAYHEQSTFNYQTGLKTHFKLCFIQNGAGLVKFDTISIPVIDSCCICLNEQDRPEIMLDEKASLQIIYFKPQTINTQLNFDNIRKGGTALSQTAMLDVFWLKPFITRTEKYCGFITPGIAAAHNIAAIVKKIKYQLYEQDTAQWPCRSRSYLFELLNIVNHIYEQQDHENMSGFDGDDDINDLIIYLNAHYNQKITLPDLAYHFNTNRTSISEKFKKVMNMSIIDYITKVRIQIACAMLRDTNLPVSEILFRVGYEDKTHFRRVFRKQTDYSPLDYRKHFQPDRIY